MPRITRRDLIASLSASAALLANRASACDVWWDEANGVPTKSYNCTVSDGQSLTTTFMRLSDVMFDGAGGTPLPGPMSDYQNLVRDHRLIDTPALATFTQLFEAHSFAFEPQNIGLAYDMRGQNLSGEESLFGDDDGFANRRWRTLGVWDDTLGLYLPAFPLPDLLRQSFQNANGAGDRQLLRYATRADFQDLGAKMADYTGLWNAKVDAFNQDNGFGNIEMLAAIDAGSVDGFIPIMFDPRFYYDGCSGEANAGALYVPPALYVDVVVCRNNGTQSIQIDDMFGAIDAAPELRTYNPTTPPQEERFGWQPVTLAPGESIMAVQRLLFGFNSTPSVNETEIKTKRAVYGPTHLPKGVIVNGTSVAFDGRSHNAVILASFANCCSCPYLESWCARAEEWIDHGKVLTECDAPEKAGKDTRNFIELRTRFRISEREHEDTTLTGATLTLFLEDGTTWTITHPDGAHRLSIGESVTLEFDVPAEVAGHAKHSTLTLFGHYEKFTQARFENCAAALAY